MGKIKSKLIRRTAKNLIVRGVEFTEEFEKNKKMLVSTISSKKIRNQVAGFLSRIKTMEKGLKSVDVQVQAKK